MAIINDGRLEYEVGSIDVNYPNDDKEVYFGSTPLIVPNNWAPSTKFPVKGDIIAMDGKDYRVLNVNDTIAEVVCLYATTDNTIQFDTNSSYTDTYANKNIDTYCNSTFYGGLSSSIKSAIVDKTFTQDCWSYTDGRYNPHPTAPYYTGKFTNGTIYYLKLSNSEYGTSITRHCYCLAVQDVLDYLECTASMDENNTTLIGTNVLQMLWNVNKDQNLGSVWLRSAQELIKNQLVFYVTHSYGYINRIAPNNFEFVHPAFQIDLSKVEYTIK